MAKPDDRFEELKEEMERDIRADKEDKDIKEKSRPMLKKEQEEEILKRMTRLKKKKLYAKIGNKVLSFLNARNEISLSEVVASLGIGAEDVFDAAKILQDSGDIVIVDKGKGQYLFRKAIKEEEGAEEYGDMVLIERERKTEHRRILIAGLILILLAVCFVYLLSYTDVIKSLLGTGKQGGGETNNAFINDTAKDNASRDNLTAYPNATLMGEEDNLNTSKPN